MTAGTVRREKRGISPPWLLGGVIVLFGAFQIVISWHKYWTLQASTMDLGYFEQAFWDISHGNWWAFSSVFQTPAVAADGSLWLYPLAYGFRYLGGDLFLFTVQAVGTGFAAWGIYRAARIHQLSSWHSVAVAILFLLYPAVLGGSQFDFHPDFVALPFLVWAYVFYRMGRYVPYYLLLTAASLAKNMALVSLMGWGLGLLVWERQIRDGMIVLTGSFLLFWLELGYLIPRFFLGGTEPINDTLYAYLGHGISGVIRGILFHPDRVWIHLTHQMPYALLIFGPVLGISLVGRAAVGPTLALWCLNALSTFHPQHKMTDQYQVMLAGWLFLALIEALSRLTVRRRMALMAVGLTVTLLEAGFIDLVIGPMMAVRSAPVASVQAAVAQIPANSVVWTQNRLGVWAYRLPLLGIDRGVTPEVMVSALPRLWAESPVKKHPMTELLGLRPTTLYFADVVAHALAAGYRVTFHRHGVFVVTGDRRFSVPRAGSVDYGSQPGSSPWIIPPFTQMTEQSVMQWKTLSLKVLPHIPGLVIPSVPLILGPGRYRVGVVIRDPNRVGSRKPWGYLQLGSLSRPIRGSTPVTWLSLTLTKEEGMNLSVTTTGVQSFDIQNLVVERLASS